MKVKNKESRLSIFQLRIAQTNLLTILYLFLRAAIFESDFFKHVLEFEGRIKCLVRTITYFRGDIR